MIISNWSLHLFFVLALAVITKLLKGEYIFFPLKTRKGDPVYSGGKREPLLPLGGWWTQEHTRQNNSSVQGCWCVGHGQVQGDGQERTWPVLCCLSSHICESVPRAPSHDPCLGPCIATQLWGPQGHMGREFSMDGRHLESHGRFKLRRQTERLGLSGREGGSRGWGWHLVGRKEGAVGNMFIFNYLLIIQELFSTCLLCAQVGSSWDACPGSLWDRTLPP